MANSYTEALQEKNADKQISLRKIIENIKDSRGELYWPNENAWVQYVKDHYPDIKKSSTELLLDPNDARIYAYSLEAFMGKNHIPKSLGWIISWLNDLDSVLHFSADITSIRIPSIQYMEELRRQYITNRVLYRRALDTTEL